MLVMLDRVGLSFIAFFGVKGLFFFANCNLIVILYLRGEKMAKYGQSLEFYGNHNIDFANNDFETLVNLTIPKLQEIPIPDEIYIILNEAFRLMFPGQPFGEMFLLDIWVLFYPSVYPYFSFLYLYLDQKIK